MGIDGSSIFNEVLSAGWSFPQSLFFEMTPYEKSFVQNEFTGLRTPSYYEARLRQIQFSGHSRVLDAACGMGQWSLALAEQNEFVEGIDLSEKRVEVAKKLASEKGCSNIHFQVGSIESLPFGDEYFDAVFCYGSFMFTDMQKTLTEFKRVLKPGGKIYVNANGFGWYMHLVFTLGLLKLNFGLAKTACRMVIKAFTGGRSQMMVTPAYLDKLGTELALQQIGISHEGGISLGNGESKCTPAYKTRYFGIIGIWEVVWKK